jgi:peptidoglycan/xylan/chitin deacetylase (PgdA/CDA1 family)
LSGYAFMIERLIGKGLPLLLNTRGKQCLSILIYHRVLESPDFMQPSEPDVKAFSWQMQLVAEHFNVLGLQEAVERMRCGTLPERALCITFDDGYADNATLAQPILESLGLPATVFVATQFLNGGRMWNDTVIETVRSLAQAELDLSGFGLQTYSLRTNDLKRQSARAILGGIKHLTPQKRQLITDHIASLVTDLPTDLMLTNTQIQGLHASGVEIGGHTHSHPILAALSIDDAKREISLGKTTLESIIGAPIKTFAYPNGRPESDFFPQHRDFLAELGFTVAVTTQAGVSAAASDPLMLARFTPWDGHPIKFMTRLLLNERNIVV